MSVVVRGKRYKMEKGRLALMGLGIENINEIEGLYDLTGLLELDLGQNNIIRLGLVKEIPTLQKVDLSNNKLTVLNGLEMWGNLVEVNAEQNRLENIDVLEKLPRLQKVLLAGNPVVSPVVAGPNGKDQPEPELQVLLTGIDAIPWNKYHFFIHQGKRSDVRGYLQDLISPNARIMENAFQTLTDYTFDPDPDTIADGTLQVLPFLLNLFESPRYPEKARLLAMFALYISAGKCEGPEGGVNLKRVREIFCTRFHQFLPYLQQPGANSTLAILLQCEDKKEELISAIRNAIVHENDRVTIASYVVGLITLGAKGIDTLYSDLKRKKQGNLARLVIAAKWSHLTDTPPPPEIIQLLRKAYLSEEKTEDSFARISIILRECPDFGSIEIELSKWDPEWLQGQSKNR
jgi:hypothetical protein